MLRIALTGGIASGKSLVGAVLNDLGLAVCDADRLAHELMEPGKPAYRETVATFGEDILRPDGTIDRSVLGARVFSDAGERARLNAIVHPRVKGAWEAWLAGLDETQTAAVVTVPLLFEAGMADGWDAVVCVTARRIDQLERLGRRGLSEGEALRRIDAQMPMDEKAGRSDYVIPNEGTVDALRSRVNEVMTRILER